MKVEVAEPRWTLTEESNRLRFIIPPKRTSLSVYFLALDLCGWAAIEVLLFAFFRAMFDLMPPLPVVLLLLGVVAVSTLPFAVTVCASIWKMLRREIVSVRPDRLSLRWEARGLGHTKEYDLRQISKLKAAPPPLWLLQIGRALPLAKVGSVSFSYRSKEQRFGDDLDQAEASLLVGIIKERFDIPDEPRQA